MKILLLLLIPALLGSCVYADKDRVAMLGGKGAYKGRDFGLVWDGEKSFRDGAATATMVAGAYLSAATAEAREVTSQVSNTNATNQAIETTKAVEATKQLQITTDAELKALELAQ